MPLVPLDDILDPRLDPYREVRDKDLAGRERAFVIEGRVVLQTVLRRGRYPLRSVLVSRRKLDGLTSLLDEIPRSVPIYTLPHEHMVEVVGFPIHRGLLAIGERPEEPGADMILSALSPGPATVLVLEGLTNTDNVGACFRNAAAFGVQAVLLDATCCDPLYRRAMRVSAGCAAAVPFGREPSQALLEALKRHGFFSIALALTEGAAPLAARARPAERVALWLGSEGPGLRPETIAGADARRVIPMASGIDSLNVATAGAVALFALQRPG
ncbi:MAG: RNA methyltransferase [Myxococcales bacterium]|nr:RNA methyltransferase [Myxococcales bacterium]